VKNAVKALKAIVFLAACFGLLAVFLRLLATHPVQALVCAFIGALLLAASKSAPA
jgi:hypothetical protein